VRYPPTELTAEERTLQKQVREFLAAKLPWGTFEPGLGMDGGCEPAFSRALGERGWLGMAVPARYGGAGATAVKRFVVTEELLRWGAPLLHHWVADRQTAPVLLRFGTDEQKERFLPAICRGEVTFCIGMSEPDAGSDLAAVRTRAQRTERGWVLNGAKIWTSNAMRSDYFVALCRTSNEENRHDGLSQFIVDLRSEGITINPIPFISGHEHFAEVVLDNVFVPDDMVLGRIGDGWAQNTSELAYERGGPDRWLSTWLLLQEFVREHPDVAGDHSSGSTTVGKLIAQYWALRRLSLSVARSIDEERTPAAESALVKEMGTRFEQDVITALHELVDIDPLHGSHSLFERLLYRATLEGPSYTIRGGTVEILRSVAARGL
jgi:alkylation response protein AidB-like acyl-CoA dehydrogenase